MEDLEPRRRSARGRIPNKKYSVVAFEFPDLSNSDSESPSPIMAPLDDPSEDEEFHVNPGADEPDAEEESSSSTDEVSDKSGTTTLGEDLEDAESDSNEVNVSNHAESSAPSNLSFPHITALASKTKNRPDRNLHSRGVVDPNSFYFSYSKESHIKFYIGLDDEDVTHLVLSRDQWVWDPTLPSRKADTFGQGGMAYHITLTAEKRKLEATVAWDWFYNRGGKRWMAERQVTKSLSTAEASAYFPTYCNPFHTFVMGPQGSQKAYKLSTSEYMKLNEAWQNSHVEDEVGNEDEYSHYRNFGWILNLGTPIRCLAWAPNQSGDIQYLAIASPVTPEDENVELSAFAPSKLSSASIQIWAFAASGLTGKESFMETDRAPQLVHAICTDWGYVKALSWCPYLRDLQDEDVQGKFSLGLLAVIWGDGYVRVLEVHLERDPDASGPYVKYESVGFESKPPDSICTCVTWLSNRELVAGCANGFVAIWDISEHMNPSSDPLFFNTSPDGQNAPADPSTKMCYPFFYQMFHQTYILNITSAYPDHPYFLITSSMDGYLRLIDLRNPLADNVLSSRSRNMARNLEYHEPLQSIIAPDENDFVRAFPLRRFFTSINFAKVEGLVLSTAVGKFHPCVLVGCADGSVIATNPLRRVLNGKAQQYQQKLFQHEYLQNGNGISRFTEGFKLESPILMRNLSQEKTLKESAVHSTLQEEESGITQIAWNPNIRCGGWAAIGTGRGFLRVEDLAV